MLDIRCDVMAEDLELYVCSIYFFTSVLYKDHLVVENFAAGKFNFPNNSCVSFSNEQIF